MEHLSLALLQKDACAARCLSRQLCSHFNSIHVARTAEELRDVIIRFRTDVVVVDIESASLAEVQKLHREFANVCIVCTHRLADEQMWTAALEAGADDICLAVDTRGIVVAATRNLAMSHSAAA
jgi:DNA-binding NarL/FixJ family response regulator